MALTPKQEGFCKSYIETGNASEAYRLNYECENSKPATINRKATELMANGTITARVAELQHLLQKRHEVTVDSLTAEYEEARALAIKEAQTSAAVSATTGKAKLHGLVTDKHNVTGKVTIQELLADGTDA